MTCSPLTSAQGFGEQGAELATGTTRADGRAEVPTAGPLQPAIPSNRTEPSTMGYPMPPM